MPQLITLSKLATLVSENTGFDIATCEAFIRNMAQTAASGLIEGEHIRIKDFGLFEPAHSVDGTPTIEFVPESLFAERVNAPFAHLRPSVQSKQSHNIPAGSQMPKAQAYAQPQAPVFPQQPEAPAYAQPQAPVFPQQPEAPAFAQPQAPAFPQQPEAPAYTQPQAPVFPQQPEAPAYTQPQAPVFPQQPEAPTYAQPQAPAYTQPQAPAFPQQPEAPAYIQQMPDFSQGPALPSSQQDGSPDLPSYLNLPDPEQTDISSSDSFSSDSFTSTPSHPLGFNRKLPELSTNKKYVLIGVLGVFVGFVIGYLTGRNTTATVQDTPETEQAAEKVAENVTSPPTEQEYDYGSALSVADEDTLLTEDEDIDTPEVQPEPQTVTVKLQKGQRLSDIAQKHYGKKEYWVYIYLENRESISNPFTVREGAVLRIPPKDKYAPTTDEATNLAWAKSKAAEINGKYIN